jgi:hypothetical protein
MKYTDFFIYEVAPGEPVKLTGGVGDATAPSQVDPTELAMGVTVEMEHTTDPDIATEIALDHLTEVPNYYSQLKKAGLAKELDACGNPSGLGDPNHPINDKPRLGTVATATAGNNIVKFDKTPNGSIDGRRDDPPIVNKDTTVDIEIPDEEKLSLTQLFKESLMSEKNVPTNKPLWSRAKSAARSKFKVYPSAYANGWAVQWYKKHGGGWRKTKKKHKKK